MGVRGENDLTNLPFWAQHPEAALRKIRPDEKHLANAWVDIRDSVVRPALKKHDAPHSAKRSAAKPSGAGAAIAKRAILTNEERKLLASPPDHEAQERAAEERVAAVVGAINDQTLNRLLTLNHKGRLTIGAVREKTGKTLTPDELVALQAALSARWAVGVKAAELSTARVKAAMERDINHAGFTVEDWFGAIESADFLGVPVARGIHSQLREKLDTAAGEIKRRLGVSDDAVAAEKVGLYSLSGLRRPKAATGGSKPSLHCYGLAVDINYRGNPFVRSRVTDRATRRAMLLLHGVESSVLDRPARDDAAQWERLHAQSEALKQYLALADEAQANQVGALAEALRAKGIDNRSDAEWLEQILADARRVPRQREFSGHTDPAAGGFMDLEKALVEELTNAGLTWGGRYKRGKDLMHFAWEGGPLQRR